MKDLTALGNIKLGEDHIICTINPKIYSLDIVYSAAYILIDKAYILLDGDPQTKIEVEIRQKEDPKVDLQVLAQEFNEQLLNYAVYKVQSERNKELREAILKRVLLTNIPLTGASEKVELNVKDDKEIMKPHPDSSTEPNEKLFESEDGDKTK
ncbi:hypothetical protein ACFLZ7_03170 [Nanoarchaeota archaeon]